MSNFIRKAVAVGAFNAGLMGLSHEAYAVPAQEAPQQETTTTTTETTLPQEETTTTTSEVEQLGCDNPDNIEFVQDGDTNFYDGYDKITGKFCARLIIPPPAPIVKEQPTEVLGIQVVPELPRTGNGADQLALIGMGALLLGAGLVLVEKSKYISEPDT